MSKQGSHILLPARRNNQFPTLDHLQCSPLGDTLHANTCKCSIRNSLPYLYRTLAASLKLTSLIYREQPRQASIHSLPFLLHSLLSGHCTHPRCIHSLYHVQLFGLQLWKCKGQLLVATPKAANCALESFPCLGLLL